MIGYEIHVLSQGDWKINSFFDDEELALLEAGRIVEGRRYPAVRVTRETADENGRFFSETIFRSSVVDEHNSDALTKKAETRRDTYRARYARRQNAEAARSRSGKTHRNRPLRKSRTKPSLAVYGITLIVILGGGFAAMWFLSRISV